MTSSERADTSRFSADATGTSSEPPLTRREIRRRREEAERAARQRGTPADDVRPAIASGLIAYGAAPTPGTGTVFQSGAGLVDATRLDGVPASVPSLSRDEIDTQTYAALGVSAGEVPGVGEAAGGGEGTPKHAEHGEKGFRKRMALTVGAATAAAAVTLGTVGAVAIQSETADAAESPEGYLDLRAEMTTSRSAVVERTLLDQPTAITVVVDGESQEITVNGGTVADALAAAGVIVGEHDIVSVQLSAPVEAGQEISVTRVDHVVLAEELTDEYEVIRKETANLDKGEERVTTPGVDGLAIHTYSVRMAGGEEVSRSEIASVVTRERVDEVVEVGTREPRSSGSGGGGSAPSSGPVMAGSNREIGQQLAADRGWTGEQWQCLDSLWQRESNWNHLAANSSSGAYGIPQSLPGSKMSSVAADWRTNPATQITWGLGYISGRYGTPCGAWNHSQQRGWY